MVDSLPRRGCLLLLWLLVLLPPLAKAERIDVVVSMQPLARAVNSAAPPDSVAVLTLLERGVTPHDARLRPSQVKALLDADLVYWWGPEVEPYLAQWIRKRSAPSRDLSVIEGIITLPMRSLANHTDGEAHHHHHGDSSFDIHLWWSRHNLQLALAAIQQDLVARRPDLAPALQVLADAHQQRWATLAAEAKALGARQPRYVVFHDGWQYLEHDLGVAPEAHLISHDELQSGAKRLLDLKKRFAGRAPACALVEPGMNTDLVDKLLPGARKLTLDPLGWDAPGSDLFSMFSHAYVALADCAGF